MKSLIDQWHNDFVASQAISRGVAIGQFVVRQLPKAFPEFQAFKFGYFVEEDLPMVIAKGWRMLRVADLPEADNFRENFNREASTRFGLIQKADTSLWYKNLAICYMPIWLYDRQQKAAAEAAAQEATAERVENTGDGEIRSETEAWHVTNTPKKRPVGRPKRSAE